MSNNNNITMETKKPIPIDELKPEKFRVGEDFQVITWDEKVFTIRPYYFDDGTNVDPNVIDGFGVYRETPNGEEYVGNVYEITEDEIGQFKVSDVFDF